MSASDGKTTKPPTPPSGALRPSTLPPKRPSFVNIPAQLTETTQTRVLAVLERYTSGAVARGVLQSAAQSAELDLAMLRADQLPRLLDELLPSCRPFVSSAQWSLLLRELEDLKR